MKDQKLNIPRGKIVSIEFSPMPNYIMANTPHVLTKDSQQDRYAQLESKDFGVVFAQEGQCNTCNGTAGVEQNERPCPGHLKSVSLGNNQIFHPMLIDKLAQIMNLFCQICHRLKYRKILLVREIKDHEQQNNEITLKRRLMPQFRFIADLSEETKDVQCCGQKITYKADKQANKIIQLQNSHINDQRNELLPQRVEQIVDAYNMEDLELLGLAGQNTHPRNLIMKYLPVAPMCVRPNIMNMGSISRDQMTDQYERILAQVAQRGSTQERERIRKDIATAYGNFIKAPNEQSESLEKAKGLAERLKGKQGLLRQNVMGKRVNYCSRSVISGDPTLSLDQLGVPKSIAMKLTFPETVTERNRDFLQRLVRNGQQYPGAACIDTGNNQIKRLLNENHAEDLQVGWVVHRHLLDGDYVIFNRQPSLHKMSFMAHRAKILPYSTFRLNLCCTRPYNADFDGDEMNCHEPQSFQAIAEMAEIMLVSKQIISCKNNAPLISIVQDSLVGAYICTDRDKFISKNDFQNYMMFIEYPDNLYRPGHGLCQESDQNAIRAANFDFNQTMTGTADSSFSNQTGQAAQQASQPIQRTHHCLTTPQPAILFPVPQWTGKQLFSLSLPAKINFRAGGSDYSSDRAATIMNGELLTGRCGKSIIGQSQGGLVHILFNDFSPEACKAFLNNCQRTFTQMMIDHSFSIGFGDMLIDSKTRQMCDDANAELLRKYETIFTKSINNQIKLAPGQTNEQGFEQEFNTAIQKTSEDLGKIARAAMGNRNALVCMLDSGSKGGRLNIQQIAAGVGQQLLQGSRMNYKFLTYRTLPHFYPFDYGLASRGYVYNSFIQGMSVYEFFFHMTGGREGVCDTAIKTADSGYVERKLMKNMESITLCYDNSVRNEQNQLIQLRYGDDNLNTHYCEENRYEFIGYTDVEFFREFYSDFGRLLLEVRPRRGAGPERAHVELESLVEKFATVQKQRLCDYGVQDAELQEFGCVLEPDLLDHEELMEYLRAHIWLIRNGRFADATPELNTFMTEEAISQLKNRQDTLKLEYLVLLAERRLLQRSQLAAMEANKAEDIDFSKNLACDLNRVLATAIDEQTAGVTPQIISQRAQTSEFVDRALTDLDQAFVVDQVNAMLARIAAARPQESRLFRAITRQVFASKRIVYKARLSKELFLRALRTVEQKYTRAGGIAGDPVGPLASHSISEPATQLTLNTFHSAGTSQLSNAGLGRLKELIDFRNASLPMTCIYLNKTLQNAYMTGQDVEKGERQRQAIALATAQIENTYFRDFVRKYEIVFDPDQQYGPDREWLDFVKGCGQTTFEEFSPFVLRYEVSLRQLVEKEVIDTDVAAIVRSISAVRQQLKGAEIHLEYYDGLGQQVIRVYFDKTTRDIINQINSVNDQILGLHVSGEPKIRKVFWNQRERFVNFALDGCTPSFTEIVDNPDQLALYGGIYRGQLRFGPTEQSQVREMFILTEGSDLVTMLGKNGVDATRTFSNDLPEIYDVLGIEAARSLLISELNSTLSKQGVNRRHFQILADIMTASPYRHKMVSINRHGMRNTNTGVLAQASFEQPADAFLAGAAYGLIDNCQSVSTAVAIGREIRHGTSSFELLLDTDNLPRQPDTIHPNSQMQSVRRTETVDEGTVQLQSQVSVMKDNDFFFNSVSASASQISTNSQFRQLSQSHSNMTNLSRQASQQSQQTKPDPYASSVRSQRSYKSASNQSNSQSVSNLNVLSNVQRSNSMGHDNEDEDLDNYGDQQDNDAWI